MAYKRILYGTDGTERAARSAHVATGLANAGKAQLIVAHVWERPDGADQVLAKALADAEAAGVKRLEGELHGGRPPADVMIELAESRDVGLIVVSGGRSSISLGPTADRLSHHAPRDLLIVMNTERGVTLEDGSERLYRRVLIATDGSATADRAARKGYDLAESVGAPVTLVFVGHPATGRLVTEDTAAVYGVGVETDVVMKQGDPSEGIVEAAHEVDADLIVVGNKGMQGAKRFFLNPVPEKVLDLSDRDVLDRPDGLPGGVRAAARRGRDHRAGGGAARRIHGSEGRAPRDVGQVHPHGLHRGVERHHLAVRVSVPRLEVRTVGRGGQRTRHPAAAAGLAQNVLPGLKIIR